MAPATMSSDAGVARPATSGTCQHTPTCRPGSGFQELAAHVVPTRMDAGADSDAEQTKEKVSFVTDVPEDAALRAMHYIKEK